MSHKRINVSHIIEEYRSNWWNIHVFLLIFNIYHQNNIKCLWMTKMDVIFHFDLQGYDNILWVYSM